MIFVDCAVSDDCINHNSYGEICLKCGCCSRNPDYRDRVIRIIRLYRESLHEQKNFDLWSNNDELKRLQERNIKSNILYCKRKIRFYRKILHTLRKHCK